MSRNGWSRSGKRTPRRRCRRNGCRPSTSWTIAALTAAFADSAAWWRPEVSLYQPGSEPVRVSAIETSANLFQLLGVSPQLGAGFSKGRSVLLARSNRRHQRSPLAPALQRGSVHRRPRPGNERPVHRSPASCRPDSTSLTTWTCGCGCSGISRSTAAARTSWKSIARLQPGVTAEQAARELAAVSARLGEANPATNRGWLARPVPLLDDMLGLLPAGALRAARRGRAAPAHRLPERRQPAARARDRAGAGDRGPRRARRVAGAAAAADARREPAARAGRDGGRRVRRSDAAEAGDCRRPGGSAAAGADHHRSAAARRRAGDRRRHRDPLRPAAGPGARRARRRPRR